MLILGQRRERDAESHNRSTTQRLRTCCVRMRVGRQEHPSRRNGASKKKAGVEEEVGSWAGKGFVSLGFALRQQPTERRRRKGPQKVHKTERRRAVGTEGGVDNGRKDKKGQSGGAEKERQKNSSACARGRTKNGLTKEPRWERFRFIDSKE
ncbi:hypothetical protein ERJ75_000570300 [Trypanosoma vivax]|nr:hypothetical protein ERJ75_000570300 [Trypanosoma vivax]